MEEEKEHRFIEAVKQGDMATLRTMLDVSPELVRAKSDKGESAVLLAVYYGRKEVADLLLDRLTALTVHEASACGRLDALIAALEKHPAALEAVSTDGWRPLHLAAFFGHLHIVRHLVSLGASLNPAAENEMRVRPLHSALSSREQDVAVYLIEHGADVTATQSADWTPLHYAAATGNERVAELLVASGAPLQARTDQGKLAWELAQENSHEQLARRLRAAGGSEPA